MPTKKLTQWLDEKASKFRDAIERLVDAAGGNNQLEPIPIRVEREPRRAPPRR